MIRSFRYAMLAETINCDNFLTSFDFRKNGSISVGINKLFAAVACFSPTFSSNSSCWQWYPILLKTSSKGLKLVGGVAKIAGYRSLAKSVAVARDGVYWLDSYRNLSQGKIDLRLRYVKRLATNPLNCIQEVLNCRYSKIVEKLDFRACKSFAGSCLDSSTLVYFPLLLSMNSFPVIVNCSGLAEYADTEIGATAINAFSTAAGVFVRYNHFSEGLRAGYRLTNLLACGQIFVRLSLYSPSKNSLFLPLTELIAATVEATRSFFYFTILSGVVSPFETGGGPMWLDALSVQEFLGLAGAALGLYVVYMQYRTGESAESQYSAILQRQKSA